MGTEWSEEVLEETPARSTKFLSGVGALPVVRTQLESAGLTDADIEEGRTLLMNCLAAPSSRSQASDTESARKQREAVAELDAWDEPNFARYRAALARHHPAVGEVVFQDLAASSGSDAVQGVATFLLRVDGLEHAAGARKGKVADTIATAATAFDKIPAAERKAAFALLEKRGLDAATRTHLAGLVAMALGPTEALAALPATEAGRTEKRREAQRALKAWFEEWSSVARAVVKKRAHLIRLGLASRKSPSKSGGVS